MRRKGECEINITILYQQLEIDKYNLIAAKYKAYFFGKYNLAKKLENQIGENNNVILGEFDGYCYSSWKTSNKYRTLENMVQDGFLTINEYNFCKCA